MNKRIFLSAVALGLTLTAANAEVSGWLNWRGPEGTGVSRETGLPSALAAPLWSVKLSGGGTPVIAGGKLFALGYEGVGADLQEVLLCEIGRAHV